MLLVFIYNLQVVVVGRANESHTYTIHRFTDTTGQYLVKVAGEPSPDPVFLLDSDALASAKAATA